MNDIQEWILMLRCKADICPRGNYGAIADSMEKMLAVVEAAKPVRDSIMSEVKTVTGTEACDLDDALIDMGFVLGRRTHD